MGKIAVVGGGLSGLSATYYLYHNLVAQDISVFDKSWFWGGRVKTQKFCRHYVDVGAQFLTNTDAEAFNLVNKLDLGESVMKLNMNFSFRDGRKSIRLSALNLLKETSIQEKKELTKLFAKTKRLSKMLDTLPPDADSDYTKKTFEVWYEEEVGEKMLWLLDSMIRSISFVDSKKISALYGLLIMKALFDQCYSFKTGLSMIIKRLVKNLPDVTISNQEVVELSSLKLDEIIISVPFPEAKKLVPEIKKFEIEYSKCTYLLLALDKRLWSKGWAIFMPKDSRISFLTDETLKFANKSKENTVLGVIVPDMWSMEGSRLVSSVISEINRFFPISEENIIASKIFKWEYALPIPSPEFHKVLRQIKGTMLNNIYLCGDYMSLPSLDGAIESGRLAAEQLAKKRRKASKA